MTPITPAIIARAERLAVDRVDRLGDVGRQPADRDERRAVVRDRRDVTSRRRRFPLTTFSPAEAVADGLALESGSAGGEPVGAKSLRLTFPCSSLATRSRVVGVTFLRAAACASCSATSSPWRRNASSERSENWATTIAVDVAATTANAIPSHQRTPMKGFGTCSIVGFPACRKAIRSIAPRQRLQVLVGSRSRSRRRIRAPR